MFTSISKVSEQVPAKEVVQHSRPERIVHGPVPTHSIANIQRKATTDHLSSAQQSLVQRTHDGVLTRSDVEMTSTKLDLSESAVSALKRRTDAIRNPEAKPLAEGLKSGEVDIRGGRLRHPGLGAVSASVLPRCVDSLGAKEARIERSNNQYRLLARMNPWIQVAAGKITAVDYGPVNKHMPGWSFVKTADLTKAGISSTAPVGASWPVSGGSSYSVPSATFGGLAMPPSFAGVPAEQLPSVPTGYAWTGGPASGVPWTAYRDPTVCPASPVWGIEAEDPTGTNLHYTSWMGDPTPAHPGNTRVLSAFAQAQPKGSGYGGPRAYPMTTADYTDASGFTWGRGHAVDHFDGSTATTTSAWNYVPEDPDFNQGARNSLVQGLRPGGSYAARYEYSGPPQRTADSSMVPDTEHFSTWDSGGTQVYYQVPNQAYPPSRKQAAVAPFMLPAANWPKPPTF